MHKRPITYTGQSASSTNADTWAPYADAAASRVGHGLGFVLDGDGIICLDLDHCITDGVLAPWAADLLATLPPTYIEVSPSGSGLHVWGYGDVDHGRRVACGSGEVEVYGWGRYITITAVPYLDAPSRLADITLVISALLTRS